MRWQKKKAVRLDFLCAAMLRLSKRKSRRISFFSTLAFFVVILTISVVGTIFLAQHALSRPSGIIKPNPFRRSAPPASPIHVEDKYKDLRMIKETSVLLKRVSAQSDKIRFDQEAWEDCRRDEDFFRMYVDPKCMMLWLYKLQWEPVVFMDHIVGVMTLAAEKEDPDARDKAMSNGGLRTFLEDNDTMGYWKPCTLDTGHKETFITEIISFWVDRLLGFYHTPAVVPRYLDRSELKQLARTVAGSHQENADKEAPRKIDSFINLCGSPRQNLTAGIKSHGVEGAHVGWSFFDLQGMNTPKKRKDLFVRFKDLQTVEEVLEVRETWFNVNSHSPVEERRKAVEILSIHLYSLLVGNLKKFDHNLFRALGRNGSHPLDGPYVYIDNDRSQWKKKIPKLKGMEDLNPMAIICKFPERIAHRILLLRSGNKANKGHSLGQFISSLSERVFDRIMYNVPMFSLEERHVMDKNIDYVASMIDECVALHGAENVFVKEPWPQPEDYMSIRQAWQELAIAADEEEESDSAE